MSHSRSTLVSLLACLSLSGAIACSNSANNDDDNHDNHDTASQDMEGGSTADLDDSCAAQISGSIQVDNFLTDGLTTPPEEVDCTLSDGTETTCIKISIKGAPSDHEAGPFCPRSITDGPETVGTWIENGQIYDLDGSFIKNLAEFYNDDTWQLYDEGTGLVNVTTTQEACEAAARPDVAAEYNNFCVECSLDYVDGGIAKEYLIPKVPIPRDANSELGGTLSVGVAFNGVQFDPPAPTAAILAAYTIAAFDDCGGHINTATGYHYHAATGCSQSVEQCDGHAPLIGYAMDGYGMYAMNAEGGTEPADLDECRGHTDETRGYHYHVASPGENMFIGCYHGKTVESQDTGGGGMMGGGEVAVCATPDATLCCGDGVCGGPETAANCAEDCP